jgi:hypothetical protein
MDAFVEALSAFEGEAAGKGAAPDGASRGRSGALARPCGISPGGPEGPPRSTMTVPGTEARLAGVRLATSNTTRKARA